MSKRTRKYTPVSNALLNNITARLAGDVKPAQIFSIEGRYFESTGEFNVYDILNELHPETTSVRKSEALALLERFLVKSSSNIYEPTVEEAKDCAKYRLHPFIPTSQDIRDVWEYIRWQCDPEKMYIVALLAMYWKRSISSINTGTAVKLIFENAVVLKPHKHIRAEALEYASLNCMRSMMKVMQDQAIEAFGFEVTFVGSGDTVPSFAYTTVLEDVLVQKDPSVKKDITLIMRGNIGPKNAHAMISEIANRCLKGECLEDMVLNSFHLNTPNKDDDIDLRSRLIKVLPALHKELKKEEVLLPNYDKADCYMLLIADGKNILPGEPGYDVKFRQLPLNGRFNPD